MFVLPVGQYGRNAWWDIFAGKVSIGSTLYFDRCIVGYIEWIFTHSLGFISLGQKVKCEI